MRREKAWAGFEDSHFLRRGLNIEIQIIQSQDAIRTESAPSRRPGHKGRQMNSRELLMGIFIRITHVGQTLRHVFLIQITKI